MRDLAFILFFFIIIFVSYRKPFIAVSIWLWSGLFVPVYWLYGFAESFRYNLIFSLFAMATYLFCRNKPSIRFDSIFFLIILLLIHTTITTTTALIPSGIPWVVWDGYSKVILLFIFITLTMRKSHHFDMLIWAMVLSIGFFALVEGLKFVKSFGGHQINGPAGHILADNNHMALAILVMLPLVVHLITVTPEKWLRVGLVITIFICVLAVLGTKSRGGFIGLLFVGSYFFFKSKRKARTLIAVIPVLIVAINLLPSSWYSRMNTIKTADEDSSFEARVVSWKIHTLMALERPLLGGGFKGPQYAYVWRSLALDFDELNFIPSAPAGDKPWAAHSIYFQVLGDHGFPGLTLFLLIIILAFLKLSSVEKYFRGSWESNLARMLKVSLVAYCVAGAAVSMAYFEMFYVIVGMVVCLSILQKDAEEAKIPKRKGAMTGRKIGKPVAVNRKSAVQSKEEFKG